jgi:hypothetical protein
MKQFMNYSRIRNFTLIILMLSLISACSKDDHDSQAENYDISEIVRLTHELYLKTEIPGGDETPPYLENDGLIDEYVATVDDFDQLKQYPLNRLITCLLNVGLTEEQVPMVRRAIAAYENRNEKIITQHRRAIHHLNQAMQQRTDYLIAKYRSGEITAEEFARQMHQLRERYRNAVMQIKENNAEYFKRSFRFLVKHLNMILEDYQWQEFTLCLRGQ